MTDTLIIPPPRCTWFASTDPVTAADGDGCFRLAELASLHDVFDGHAHGHERRALPAAAVRAD